MTARWKLMGPLEAANGVLMFGMTSAAVMAILQQLIKSELASGEHGSPLAEALPDSTGTRPRVHRSRRSPVPIRFATVIPGGDGTLITVLSDETLGYIGGDKKSAKPKEGFDLTYAMFSVNEKGQGRGEMSPACRIKWMESGAPAPEDYGKQVVSLDDVPKVA